METRTILENEFFEAVAKLHLIQRVLRDNSAEMTEHEKRSWRNQWIRAKCALERLRKEMENADQSR